MLMDTNIHEKLNELSTKFEVKGGIYSSAINHINFLPQNLMTTIILIHAIIASFALILKLHSQISKKYKERKALKNIEDYFSVF